MLLTTHGLRTRLRNRTNFHLDAGPSRMNHVRDEFVDRAPIIRINGGRPADVIVGVVIEGQHDVFKSLYRLKALCRTSQSEQRGVLDVERWLAGARTDHRGVIECNVTDDSVGSLLKTRYECSPEIASLRSGTRGSATPLVSNWGALRLSGLTPCSRTAPIRPAWLRSNAL